MSRGLIGGSLLCGVDCRVLRLIFLHSRRGSREIAAQRRMRHDTSRDAINDKTGNDTPQCSLSYNIVIKPVPPIQKWLGRLFLGKMRKPFGPSAASFSTASHQHPEPVISKGKTFVHHAYLSCSTLQSYAFYISVLQQNRNLVLELPKRHHVLSMKQNSNHPTFHKLLYTRYSLPMYLRLIVAIS